MSKIYHADLAWIHHVGFGAFAAGAGPGIVKLLHEAGISDGLVVDLGSGSGILARHLTEAGYRVFGVDASAAMTALARRVAPKATFRTASLHDTRFPACRAVTAIGEAIGYLASSRLAPGAYRRLFARVATALEPGGLFLFDLVIRSGHRPMEYRSCQRGSDWAVMVDVNEDPARGILHRDITAFRKHGASYRRSDERHWVRIDRRDDVVAELRHAGFTVRTMSAWGTMALAPRRLAFLARKRA